MKVNKANLALARLFAVCMVEEERLIDTTSKGAKNAVLSPIKQSKTLEVLSAALQELDLETCNAVLNRLITRGIIKFNSSSDTFDFVA